MRSYVVEGNKDLERERLSFGLTNMSSNKAYLYAVERVGGDPDGSILRQYQDRFSWYRKGWRDLPSQALATGDCASTAGNLRYPPLCVDIETTAVCDLACPFCFRQWIATPDKVIDFDSYKSILDQCAELGVPSIKLNWRGEPLLHPKLPEMIDLAKQAGVLEVLINTNATMLTEKLSRQLIESGLDTMIYSFDGGTKETYEAMRPGRFRLNKFEHVYQNISQFNEIRQSCGALFPRTKIQMVLTESTYEERDQFFALFDSCVDQVSVKAYSERGGKIEELDDETRSKLPDYLRHLELPEGAPVRRDIGGALYISVGRLPCEQPFQRLLITYDGRVSMCCYDWGSQYPIGYVDKKAIDIGDKEYRKILDKISEGAKGFENMTGAVMPKKMNNPESSVRTLKEIWNGPDIMHVRQQHIRGNGEKVNVCQQCTFRDTYDWVELDGQSR
jgi:MoaA/NifB/PqqE/SkfB family radical SAM enzyme